MSFAHAIHLNEDFTSSWLYAACNADAQHWSVIARTARAELLVGVDGVVRSMVD